MFSRNEFEIACKSLAENADFKRQHMKGWIWKEHPQFPGLGYLERSTSFPINSQTKVVDDVIEEICEEDTATLDAPATKFARVWQSIAYSVSFQMPVFYFSVYTDEGSPFSLPDILECTSLFRFHPNSTDGGDLEVTKYSIKSPGATLPLISQGDHPTLGTPCHYLHPCETQTALRELIESDERPTTLPISSNVEKQSSDSVDLVRKLELWLLLVGNAIDLCISS